MNINAFEQEMTRLAVFWTAIEIIAFIVTMWVLYAVIKAAVRDGINESGLVKSWATTARKTRSEEAKDNLPDMRADR